MPLTFNMVLREAGIPLANVRLLRHKDQRAAKGRTPYELWRDDRLQFELYQSLHSFQNRKRLNVPYWASFVGTPNGETLFVGFYRVKLLEPLKKDRPMVYMDGVDRAGSCDDYRVKLDKKLAHLGGRLFIDWGIGKRSWIQRADRKEKPITELRREFKEPDFPGFLNFIKPLSKLNSLPPTWIATLKSCGGVYLLTCPKTREQYIGKADGNEGFWGRWQAYMQTGHGGNVGLKSRDLSDYQVSILEVAGTAATPDDILKMESHWKSKLQSREMGLNRN